MIVFNALAAVVGAVLTALLWDSQFQFICGAIAMCSGFCFCEFLRMAWWHA